MQKTAAKSVFAKNFSHQQYLAKEEYREKQKHYVIQAQGYTKNMKISMLSLNRKLITSAKQQ
jgi:RPA family protein